MQIGIAQTLGVFLEEIKGNGFDPLPDSRLPHFVVMSIVFLRKSSFASGNLAKTCW
jgi:hypothetical protein